MLENFYDLALLRVAPFSILGEEISNVSDRWRTIEIVRDENCVFDTCQEFLVVSLIDFGDVLVQLTSLGCTRECAIAKFGNFSMDVIFISLAFPLF